MNLSDLATSLVQEAELRAHFRWPEAVVGAGGIEQTEVFEGLSKLVEDVSGRAVMASVFLWNALSHSERFASALSHYAHAERLRRLLVFHELGGVPRYDLLLLSTDPSLANRRSVSLPEFLNQAGIRPGDLENGAEQWIDEVVHDFEILPTGGGEDDAGVATGDPAGAKGSAGAPGRDQTVYRLALLNAMDRLISRGTFREMIARQPFSLLFAPMPKTSLTSAVASPAWGVAVERERQPAFTAGVVTKGPGGRHGVTGCLHGLVADPEALPDLFAERGAACVVGQAVYVDSVLGVVRSADLITDSCFIELGEERAPATPQAVRPLLDECPTPKQRVHFEGITSQRKSTFVTGMDLNLPFPLRNEQGRVYTQPVTRPGDSGCALVDEGSRVLGFSFCRTALNEPIEFAEWIWAASVFRALKLPVY
ncbi:MAG TPA: hypothetical protein VF746_32000 [Longimicrobium sp.]|jgi:hypothetical protein